ncbi:MAG: hypothetical protein RI885_1261 [Actinomycetota bacterium]
MFEIADRLLERLEAGERLAVATAVSITGSAPRTVGTSMAVSDTGTVIGSISGGCVEGAVFELCQQVLAAGDQRVASYGFDDDTAFAVGLSCGGRIEVVATMVERGSPIIVVLRDAAAGRPTAHTLELGGDRVFTETFEPPSRLVIVGAVEFSVALAAAASAMGLRVTVCDPRSVFVTAARFPTAEIVIEWPPDYLARTAIDERTALCLLAHDDRYDTDLLEVALRSPAGYLGAMGSRRTHHRRVTALAERGIHDLARLHSPIGLDLGASTPEETAISILAEMLTVRSGRSGARLTASEGAIHGR